MFKIRIGIKIRIIYIDKVKDKTKLMRRVEIEDINIVMIKNRKRIRIKDISRDEIKIYYRIRITIKGNNKVEVRIGDNIDKKNNVYKLEGVPLTHDAPILVDILNSPVLKLMTFYILVILLQQLKINILWNILKLILQTLLLISFVVNNLIIYIMKESIVTVKEAMFFTFMIYSLIFVILVMHSL